MDASLPQLVADYGYLAVFVGTLLEGEAVLMLAGYAAHRSYLSLPAKEQAKYTGWKDWRLWWGLFVGIILSIYAFFLWWRFRHPW